MDDAHWSVTVRVCTPDGRALAVTSRYTNSRAMPLDDDREELKAICERAWNAMRDVIEKREHAALTQG